MEQEKLSKIIAENLTIYRKNANLTQLEVAEKLNYSDKSVSKWEQGNGMPDIFVLQQLAELYGVNVNDFLRPHVEKLPVLPIRKDNVNRMIVMLMATGLCWLVAVVVYVFLGLFHVNPNYTWLTFIYAIPVNFIVIIVLSSVWKFYILSTISASAIVWTGLLAIYLVLRMVRAEAYLLFFIGIPLQILVIFWFGFQYRLRKKKKNKSK